MTRRKSATLLVTLSLLLTSCGSKSTETQVTPAQKIAEYKELPGIAGSKAGVFIARTLSAPLGYTSNSRPAAMLGVYISSFIAQGTFKSFTSAVAGIEAQMRLLAGQTQVATNEVFTLMTQYSTLLQVDVPDMLNRSNNRDESLDTYMENLTNYTVLLEQKEAEMKATEKEVEARRKEQKKAVSALQSEVKRAFKNEEFEDAASKQEELAELEGILAKTETQLEQTSDMRDRFVALLKVGKRRIEAIESNRRIILSGLKVVDVPGIEDFELIQK